MIRGAIRGGRVYRLENRKYDLLGHHNNSRRPGVAATGSFDQRNNINIGLVNITAIHGYGMEYNNKIKAIVPGGQIKS